jgi:chaperone required for assembly of F1-ATPase
MKRFYQDVTVSSAPFQILLDGKPVQTPDKHALILPTPALAAAVAEEWRAQGDKIDPAAMPLTKLANTAIDRVAPAREAVVGQAMNWLNDVLCYRAEHPAALTAQQAAEWDPLLDWAAERYGARLNTRTGPVHFYQPEYAVTALREVVVAFDPFALTAVATATSILGSLVLALALAEGRLAAAEAFALSQLDERFQAARWGVDEEAAARAAGLLAELTVAATFLKLAQTP